MLTRDHLVKIKKLCAEISLQSHDFISIALKDLDHVLDKSPELAENGLKAWLINSFQLAPEPAKSQLSPLAHVIAYQLACCEIEDGQFDDFIVPRAFKLLFSKAERVVIHPGEITKGQFLAGDYLQFGTLRSPLIVAWPHVPHKKMEKSWLNLRSLEVNLIQKVIAKIQEQNKDSFSPVNNFINRAKEQTQLSLQEVIEKLTQLLSNSELKIDQIKTMIASLSFRHFKTGFTGEPSSVGNVLCAQLAWLCVDQNSQTPLKDFWEILYPEIKNLYDGDNNIVYPAYGQGIVSNDCLIHYGKIYAQAQTEKGYEKIRYDLPSSVLQRIADFYPGHQEFWNNAKKGKFPVPEYKTYTEFFQALVSYVQLYRKGNNQSSDTEIGHAGNEVLSNQHRIYLQGFLNYLETMNESDRIRFEKQLTKIDRNGGYGEVRLVSLVHILLNPPNIVFTSSCYNQNYGRLLFLLVEKMGNTDIPSLTCHALEIDIQPNLFAERALPDYAFYSLPYAFEPEKNTKLDRESLIEEINQNENPHYLKFAQEYNLLPDETGKAKNLFNFVWQLKEDKKMPFLKALLGEPLDFSLLIFNDEDEYKKYAEKICDMDRHLSTRLIQEGIENAYPKGLLHVFAARLFDILMHNDSDEVAKIKKAIVLAKDKPHEGEHDLFYYMLPMSCFFDAGEELEAFVKYYQKGLTDFSILEVGKLFLILDRLSLSQRTLTIKSMMMAMSKTADLHSKIVNLASKYPECDFFHKEFVKWVVCAPDEYDALEKAFPNHKSDIKNAFIEYNPGIPVSFASRFLDLIPHRPNAGAYSANFSLGGFCDLASALPIEDFIRITHYYFAELQAHLSIPAFKPFLKMLPMEKRRLMFTMLDEWMRMWVDKQELFIQELAVLFQNTPEYPNNIGFYFDFLREKFPFKWQNFKNIPQTLKEYSEINSLNQFEKHVSACISQEVFYEFLNKNFLKNILSSQVFHLFNSLEPSIVIELLEHSPLLSIPDLLMILPQRVSSCRNAKIKPMLQRYSIKELLAEIRVFGKTPEHFQSLKRFNFHDDFYRKIVDCNQTLALKALKIFLLLLREKPFGMRRHAETLEKFPKVTYGFFDFGPNDRIMEIIEDFYKLTAIDPLFKKAWDLASIVDDNERIRQTYIEAVNQNPLALSSYAPMTTNVLRFTLSQDERLNFPQTPPQGSRLASVVSVAL